MFSQTECKATPQRKRQADPIHPSGATTKGFLRKCVILRVKNHAFVRNTEVLSDASGMSDFLFTLIPTLYRSGQRKEIAVSSGGGQVHNQRRIDPARDENGGFFPHANANRVLQEGKELVSGGSSGWHVPVRIRGPVRLGVAPDFPFGCRYPCKS